MSTDGFTVYDAIKNAMESSENDFSKEFESDIKDDVFSIPDKSPPSGVNGVWYSEAGSTLLMKSYHSILTGYFKRNTGEIGHVIGTIDPNIDGENLALSFSIFWPPTTKGSFTCVTSYTGQYHRNGGSEYMQVVFLLADETIPAKDYSSVCVGSDNFKRSA